MKRGELCKSIVSCDIWSNPSVASHSLVIGEMSNSELALVLHVINNEIMILSSTCTIGWIEKESISVIE